MTVLLWVIAAPALLLAVGAAYAELTALTPGDDDDHTTGHVHEPVADVWDFDPVAPARVTVCAVCAVLLDDHTTDQEDQA